MDSAQLCTTINQEPTRTFAGESDYLYEERPIDMLQIATNPNSNPHLLDQLVASAPKHILIHIANNPRTSATTLLKLATHPEADVRASAGEHQRTPKAALFLLAQDSDADVRYSLAENHNIDTDVLEVLIRDDNPYVSTRAQRTLERVTSATTGSDWPAVDMASLRDKVSENANMFSAFGRMLSSMTNKSRRAV